MEQKKKIIKDLNRFTTEIDNLGLTKDRWDNLAVNIKNKFLNFPELEKIISLTDNSDLYYFKPSFLHIKTNRAGMSIDNPASKKIFIQSKATDSLNSDIQKIHEADLPESKKFNNSQHHGDVTVSLIGSFLIRKR